MQVVFLEIVVFFLFIGQTETMKKNYLNSQRSCFDILKPKKSQNTGNFTCHHLTVVFHTDLAIRD